MGMDYGSAMSKAIPGTFVPDLGDETPKTSAIPGGNVPGTQPAGPGEKTFLDTVKEVMSDVNTKMTTADHNTQDLATGKTNDLGKVVTSVEEAQLSFQFALAMRTKLLAAYQQIQQMQV
jgi:flagellar hook-basal body complex protein FliE